ncbi:MAG: D-aminoacylase, partial [Chloroflexi bacterium]|nr:D-aminoacylase [Chloroflexota bacterium]
MLLRDPVHAHGLLQGVTTEFITQDGLSYALLSAGNLDSYGRYIAGLYGPPPVGLDMSTMAAFRSHYEGKGCNVAVQAPHGPVRLESVGFEDVPLEGEGLARAERMVAEAMGQGAPGVSTGLSYYPNSYSDTDEL